MPIENESRAGIETVAADNLLLDFTDLAVKRMLKLAKKRGYVTYLELNAVLPSEEVNSEQIEDILAMLGEMGIKVVESEDAAEVRIVDVAIWIKHVPSLNLRDRLMALREGDEITLETDGIVGRWQRMKTGKDGREVFGIKPIGAMRQIWNDWYMSRRGESILIRETVVADDYLTAASALFSEWSQPDDEENFRDL